MKSLIEQLQNQTVLLFLGHQAIESDALISACQELARLPFRKVVTLGDSPRLVAAWQRAGRAIDVVSPADTQLRVDESRVTWLNLSPLHTPEPPWLAHLLRAWFATHTVCFLGCDLEDPGFKRRYREMAHAVGLHRPTYRAVVRHPLAEGYRRDWEGQNVTITVANLQDWISQLVRACDDASTKVGIQAQVAGRELGSPYQFLDYYQEADADRFFGRSAAVRDLGEMVLAERLVVCFGRSGVGKTSLLQAGLMPRLRRQGCLPLYCRPETDPIQAIRQAALHRAKMLSAPVPGATRETKRLVEVPPGPENSLADLLSGLANQTQRTVVILLDQFEETFTQLGEETAVHLAEELAACLRLPGGLVHVVLSLREDFLTHLHALQSLLPQIFAYRYRLRALTPEQARQAIEEPVHRIGLRYKPDLTDQLLHDLSQASESQIANHELQMATIEPANLQIICDALYHDLEKHGGETFTLTRYRELGGTEQFLGGYLERVVADEENVTQVRDVLKAMVTVHGTKASLPAAEIARLAGPQVEEDTAAEILRRLDRPHRLVRPLQLEDQTLYELAHDVLGPRILAWIEDPAEREAKATHDLLRTELHNWRAFGVLPGPGKLRAVHAQWGNPHLRLGADEVELMVRGALRHDVEPAAWLERAEATGVPTGDFLLPALRAPQAEVRHRAADLLGLAKAIPALARLLRDRDTGSEIRAQAATTLGEMDHPRAFRLLRRARHDPAAVVRAVAWAGLEPLNPRAAQILRRRDETAPLLLAGSLVYWLLLFVIAWESRGVSSLWPAILSTVRDLPWLAWGVMWLAALLMLNRLAPRLPPRTLSWVGGALSAWLLIAHWGWLRGGAVLLLLLLLGGDLRAKPYLGLAVLLPYVPLIGSVDAAAANLLWATGGMLVILSLLALAVPRWGRYGADRPVALALLGGGLGAAIGARLAGSDGVGLGAALMLGICIAGARWQVRRSFPYAGSSQNLVRLLIDNARASWDFLDEISFKLKPFLGSLIGAVLAAVLLQAAGTTSAWTISDALWLGVGLGVGLWFAEGGLIRALLPALGGAIGGALAQGADGAIIGAGLGLGLGFGEWMVARMEEEPWAEPQG